MAVKITGYKEIQKNLKKFQNEIHVAARKGVTAAGNQIGRMSAKQTPVVTGVLRNSLYNKPHKRTNRILTEVGYTAEYAAAVHENPYAGRTGGQSSSGQRYKNYSRVGKWKFLEDPVKHNTKMIVSIISSYLKKAFR